MSNYHNCVPYRLWWLSADGFTHSLIPSFSWWSHPSARNQHRHLRMRQDFHRGASKHEACEAGAAMRAHADQVASLLARGLDDRLPGRDADHPMALESDSGRCGGLLHDGELLVGSFPRLRLELVLRHKRGRHVFGVHDGSVVLRGEESHYGGPQRLSERDAMFDGLARDR